MSATAPAAGSPPLAELREVSKEYKVRAAGGGQTTLRAVEDVSLSIEKGTTLGLVGESGSGKSTIARLMLRLVDPTAGRVYLDGQDITGLRGPSLRRLRPRMQLVFQDPYSSFDPYSTIIDSVSEALRRRVRDRHARRARAGDLLGMVGLSPILGRRHPKEMSGGQLQRASIARALAQDPSLIALDEPVSSLDVSSQAHIINLLHRLQSDLGVAYLFVSHDLGVVRDVSHRLAVIYQGRIVEMGSAEAVYRSPEHAYTRSLLSAIPTIPAAR